MQYQKHFSAKNTPQNQPIPGKNMVENNAGGYTFQLDKWKVLERFLILGAEGGTYYATEHKLTVENAQNLITCIEEDGPRTVKMIADIASSGRAPKITPALFSLAVAGGIGNAATKRAVKEVFKTVVHTGTHLFQTLEAHKEFGGWGRSWKNTVASWYDKDPAKLAYQLVKYRQREGWTHADALRLCHATAKSNEQNLAFAWATGKLLFATDSWHRMIRNQLDGKIQWTPDIEKTVTLPDSLRIIEGYERIATVKDVKLACKLIKEYNLPWETVPSELLGEAQIWEALLPNIPIMATVRNLGRMSANGLLVQGSNAAKDIVAKLSDTEAVKASKLHPVLALAALVTYQQGHGARGKLTWQPVTKITDCLDDLFYACFGNVQPTGKSICLALDVSGSMTCGEIAGIPGLTPRQASAAMAMVTMRTEKNYEIMGFSDGFIPIDISPKMRLDTVIRQIDKLSYSATDCALPMLWASNTAPQTQGRSIYSWRDVPNVNLPGRVLPFDVFVIYTDNETWCGDIHPVQALTNYRKVSGKHAKLVVVGMTATEFSIADPNDAGMLDVVGMDTATPNLISDFIKE